MAHCEAPGAAEQAVTPSLQVFTDEYLVPLNLVPAAPGEGSPAPGIGPAPDADFLGKRKHVEALTPEEVAGAVG